MQLKQGKTLEEAFNLLEGSETSDYQDVLVFLSAPTSPNKFEIKARFKNQVLVESEGLPFKSEQNTNGIPALVWFDDGVNMGLRFYSNDCGNGDLIEYAVVGLNYTE